MKYSELCEKIKIGEITVNYNGHRIGFRGFMERYEDYFADANGANDGKWSIRDGKTMEEVNAEMREFNQSYLNRTIHPNQLFRIISEDNNCFNCGHRLYWVWDGDKIWSLQGEWEPNKNNWRDKGTDIINSGFCEYAINQPYGGEISINSKLLFTNYFNQPDTPDKMEYNDLWSLNNYCGRVRRAEYKAKNYNTAYGQLGNMSIGIFVHPNKNSIILGDKYIADKYIEKLPKQNKFDWQALSIIEDHKLVGEICCEVWRWEATDILTLGEDKYKALKDNSCDLVEVEVNHGKWRFETSYDREKDESPIYARLTHDV